MLVRIYSDELPQKANAIYLVSETADNQESSLHMGAELLRDGYADVIAMAGFGDERGYPGFQVWQSILKSDFPVLDSHLCKVPWIDRNGSFNTRTELIDLVSYATKMKWESLIIVAPPFHLARAFMCAVGQVIDQGSNLKVYAKSGFVEPWHETVVHSQGTTIAHRKDLVYIEMKAIVTYIIKGDLPKIKTVMDYLDRRG